LAIEDMPDALKKDLIEATVRVVKLERGRYEASDRCDKPERVNYL